MPVSVQSSCFLDVRKDTQLRPDACSYCITYVFHRVAEFCPHVEPITSTMCTRAFWRVHRMRYTLFRLVKYTYPYILSTTVSCRWSPRVGSNASIDATHTCRFPRADCARALAGSGGGYTRSDIGDVPVRSVTIGQEVQLPAYWAAAISRIVGRI